MGDLIIRMIRMQQCRAEAAPFAKVCHLSILQQDQGGGLAWFPEPYSTAKHAHIWQVTRTTYTVLFVSMVLTSWMKNHGISWYFGISKIFPKHFESLLKWSKWSNDAMLIASARLRWISWRCHMNLWRWTLWRVLKSSFPRSQWRWNRGQVDDSAPKGE